MMPYSKIINRIKDVLINELLIQTPRENITNDCSLINDLGLDSLQVLELIVALEVEFAIRIEDEDLNFELFNNITLLARHIDSKVKNV